MPELIIANGNGDDRVTFAVDNPAEVKAAMDRFNDLVKNHKHIAYDAGKNGEGAKLLRAFDPTVEKIVLTPQRQGG